MTSRPIGPAVAAATAGQFAPSGDDDYGRDAHSIPEFCQRHGISESFFHKLRSQGLGPRTMRIGTRVLISKEAARAWRKRHTEIASTT